jgi:hypothetical protein
VSVVGRHEASAFRTEHELVQLAVLASYSQAASFVLDRHNRATLDEATEVLDTRMRPNTGERSRRSEHHRRMLGAIPYSRGSATGSQEDHIGTARTRRWRYRA